MEADPALRVPVLRPPVLRLPVIQVEPPLVLAVVLVLKPVTTIAPALPPKLYDATIGIWLLLPGSIMPQGHISCSPAVVFLKQPDTDYLRLPAARSAKRCEHAFASRCLSAT